MKQVISLLNFVLFLPIFLHAQGVTTFASVPSNGDVAVDANGFVYTVSENTIIHRVSPQGVVDGSPFLSGGTLMRGTGLAFDPSGDTLYVTCRPLNGNGFISKVLPDGTDEVFCSNLYYPGDISFDPNGNLYVTEFNNNVTQISPAGTASIYVNSSAFNTPIGIAWTPGDTLYVSSAHDGNIYKVIPTQPTPTVQWFAHVDGLVQSWACGFMTYSNGALYITNGDNIIHQITLDGVVSDFAGTGVGGGLNGHADSCQFQAPNGIGTNMGGNKMYITEYNQSRVREIDVGFSMVPNADVANIKLYPNPAREIISISGTTPERVTVLSQMGVQLEIKKQTHQINVSELPSGIYFIAITYPKGTVYKRFLKE